MVDVIQFVVLLGLAAALAYALALASSSVRLRRWQRGLGYHSRIFNHKDTKDTKFKIILCALCDFVVRLLHSVKLDNRESEIVFALGGEILAGNFFPISTIECGKENIGA